MSAYVSPEFAEWGEDVDTVPAAPRPGGLWGAFEPGADAPVAAFGTRGEAEDWLESGAGDQWPDLVVKAWEPQN